MLAWVGLCGDLHLTFLPRKPQPLGWMLKTAACAENGIYIRLELAENKEAMAGKEFVQTHKATTACTLRLCMPWFHSNRIVVGDSWFGSVRTTLQLMARGLWCVLAIKGGSAQYPKAELLAATQSVRFSQQIRTEVFPVSIPGCRPIHAGATAGRRLAGQAVHASGVHVHRHMHLRNSG